MNNREPIKDKDIERLLRRGVAEVIVEEELREMLKSGKKLRLKEGFDPSAPDIHIGYMATLRKLRQFQELGHQVVLIIADWTAQIGDPSGMSATRQMLTAEQVRANAQTYMNQFFMVVDKDKTEIRWQNEWFGSFDLSDVIRLTSRFTVAQFLAREDFSNRYNAGKPITITELLYPLLQAYDSVAIQADVEFGGLDQKFNFLVGRELQSMMGQHPQQCFMTPLLIGTDGSKKMSQSLGNYIGVAEPPEEIYGKVMSITDSLIMDYFELLTDVPEKELAEFRQALENDAVNPMELKKRLAGDIVIQLHGEKQAQQAEEHFTRVVQKKEVPDEIPEFAIPLNPINPMLNIALELQASYKEMLKNLNPFDFSERGVKLNAANLLVVTNLAKSRSEANRLIEQGAVSIDGEKISGNVATVKSGSIIKVGKRRFAKVINTD